jgi:hypothetical protein
MYLSFETDTSPESLARAFPPAHLVRLRQLKRRYDPTSLFRDNFYIDPDGTDAPLGGTSDRETSPTDDH